MTQPECSDELLLSEPTRISSTVGSSTGTGDEMVKNASMADELVSWSGGALEAKEDSLREGEDELEWARLLSVSGRGLLSPRGI